MHDEWARDLLSGLDTGPEPPSTVDIERAVHDGRRRVRTRRATASAGVAVGAVLALAAVPAALPIGRDGTPDGRSSATPSASPSAVAPDPAPTRCALERLPPPPGTTFGVVLAGEPTGRYHAGVAAASEPTPERLGGDGVEHLVRWDGDNPVTLLTSERGVVTRLAVNAAGVVAGTIWDEATETSIRHWVYRDGIVTTLTSPGERYMIVGINAGGDVLASWSSDRGGPSRPPVVWPAGAPDRPRVLAGGSGWAIVWGIDDDGTVIGTTAAMTSPRAVVWSPDGAVRELPMPDGYRYSAGRGIRAGMASGYLARVGTNPMGVDAVALWNLPAGTMTVVPGTWLTWGVNRHGWLTGRDRSESLLIAVDGRTVPLPLPSGANALQSMAQSISDDGRTVGGNTKVGEVYQPVRWRCS